MKERVMQVSQVHKIVQNPVQIHRKRYRAREGFRLFLLCTPFLALIFIFNYFPHRWALPRDRVKRNTPAFDMMSAMPDDVTIKLNDLANMINVNCWRMIYAKDDAEFDAIWAETKMTAEGLGLSELQEWTMTAWVNALDMATRYAP
jgi:hypothetical protein